jgi:hypothetical protein
VSLSISISTLSILAALPGLREADAMRIYRHWFIATGAELDLGNAGSPCCNDAALPKVENPDHGLQESTVSALHGRRQELA